MIRILHLSDIHLGTLTHGRTNPQTGINTRLEDFSRSLTLCIDRAISEPADLVLFGGDAFPDATPPPIVQQIFATQFRRLADANIPTVLLVGNHDRHSQGQGGNSLSIYRSLAVPGFIVGDRLETHRISTKSGIVQVICLPWLTRSALLTKTETESLSVEAVGDMLLERLSVVLEAEIRQLESTLPTVLLGHLMVDRATFGAERFLAAGKGFTIPLSFLSREQFDYVALGHVHKHQVLCQQPLVVYPGSIERVDFGEEKEEKGYAWVNLSKGNTSFDFCPLPARTFRTIQVDLTQTDQPQTRLLQAIAASDISDAITRLIYKVKPEQIMLLDDRAVHSALSVAHTYSILPEVINQNSRVRLPELDRSTILDPIAALKAYLGTREDLKADQADLLAATQAILSEISSEIGSEMELLPIQSNNQLEEQLSIVL